MPQENPLRYNATGSAPGALNPPQPVVTPDVPAYTPAEQAPLLAGASGRDGA